MSEPTTPNHRRRVGAGWWPAAGDLPLRSPDCSAAALRRRSLQDSVRPDRRPAPQTALPALQGLVKEGAQCPGSIHPWFKARSRRQCLGIVVRACHDEAPLLTQLGNDKRFQIVGINYKDAPDNARRFLGRYGNPFGIVGVEATAAPRSSGASMACPRPSWSAAKAPSSTSWSAR